MGVVANEPSMEDILSSIKRIIADGSDRAASPRVPRRRGTDRDEAERIAEDSSGEEQDSAVLELTDMVAEEQAEVEVEAPVQQPTQRRKVAANQTEAQPVAAATPDDANMISAVSAEAARASLSQLSSLLVRPEVGESNTLEGMVREMLRPMLKDWLEAKLPELVESLVKKEIDRIVGRLG